MFVEMSKERCGREDVVAEGEKRGEQYIREGGRRISLRRVEP
jgi:hypothetical protein